MTAGRSLKVARFGDNMRQVAVTEGDKVEAQIQFGWSVNGYGVGDLVERVNGFSDAEANALLGEYAESYDFAPDVQQEGPARERVREQARIELGLKAFLTEGGFGAFTTTFEDLHGLKQLPGLAVQRLMGEGYGFAGRRRLEDRRAGARDENDGDGLAARHVVHGGLHLPSGTRQ